MCIFLLFPFNVNRRVTAYQLNVHSNTFLTFSMFTSAKKPDKLIVAKTLCVRPGLADWKILLILRENARFLIRRLNV